MRVAWLALPLFLVSSPVLAQAAPQRPPLQLPPELTDPRMAERLGQMTQVLGQALLNLPVGELEAIVEGRPPTAADRRRTIRDNDPKLERDLQQQLAQTQPVMEASMKALSTALPVMMQSLQQAGEALERATANLPSPNYPKR